MTDYATLIRPTLANDAKIRRFETMKQRKRQKNPIIGIRSMKIFSILVLFFSIGDRLAYAEDADEICNDNGQKIWYVAIGREVFALPYSQFFDQTGGPLVDNASPKLQLLAPNPKARIGCKDNPQQVGGFGVRDAPSAVAHLAGAMGSEVWVLSNYSPYWIWNGNQQA